MAAVAVNGNGNGKHEDSPGISDENKPDLAKNEYIEGIIYPPPDIRSIVDKTAAFTAKNANPASFEDKIKQRGAADSRFRFINADDAYNAYYQHRVKFYKEGGVDDVKAGAGAAPAGTTSTATNAANSAIAGAAAQMVDEGRPTVPQPRPYEFITTERPPIAAVDHDILKLTALFTARMGRGFTNELGSRESGNYQFDFLRPSHSLFGYFNRLVEQYTRVLMAPAETVEELDRQAGYTPEYDSLLHTEAKRRAIARREVMKGMHNRVEWEKYDNARRQAEDTAAEEERVAFASIDWQDFIVVATIDFTDNDQILDLPPPMSRSEVENMTMAQKKMAAMIMEGKDAATAAVESGAVSREAEEAEMDMSGDEADQLTKRVLDASKAPQEAKVAPSNIKIRKDYVPKSQRAKKVATSTCRICGQEIPEAEMAEHVRIELLDPRWKEKQMASDARRSAANIVAAGTDVASTLKGIASKRSDIFSTTQEDEDRRKRQEEEERIRKREREKVVWDGHTASALSTAERFQSGADLDAQIAALHRAKGLTGQESNIGPRPAAADPAEVATAAPSFLQAPGAFAGATLSAAPNPSAQAQPAVSAQEQMMQQQQQQQQMQMQFQQRPQYGYQPQYTPEQMAEIQRQQQQEYQAGQARPAEQSEESNKRQRQ